jgi:hypothetical protein
LVSVVVVDSGLNGGRVMIHCRMSITTLLIKVPGCIESWLIVDFACTLESVVFALELLLIVDF